MIKLSKRDIDKQEKAENDIAHIRKALKKEPIVIDEFNKYKRNISEIDDVSIQFDPDLDVSAKTVNGKIYLNAKMLDEKWEDYFHYAVHEIDHYLQHTTNDCDHNSNEDYLDNDNEIEAFKDQIAYRKKTEGKPVVEEYITELFDKHDLPEKERSEKRKELLREAKNRLIIANSCRYIKK